MATLFFLMVTASASASITAVSRGASAIFKNTETTHMLSLFVGIPRSRLSGMSPGQQRNVLDERLDALRQQGKGELAADIDNLFLQISRGETARRGEVKEMLHRMQRETHSVRDILRTTPRESR